MRFGVLVIAVVGLILVTTSPAFNNFGYVFAEGSAADAMCNPVKMDCECGMVKNQQTGQCEQKGPQQNMHNCPCFDNTNGHITSGKCTEPNHCKGEKTDGKAPELPKPPEMKPPEKKPPEQQQNPCGSGSDSSSTNSSSASSSRGCASDTGSSGNFGVSGSTTSAYSGGTYNYDTGSGSSGLNPFLNLLGDLQNGQLGTTATTPAFPAANFNDQGSILSSSEPQSSALSHAVGQAVSLGGGATGFASPGGSGSNGSADSGGSSIVDTAGDVVNSAGQIISNVVNSAIDTVKKAVGIGTGSSGDTSGSDSPVAQHVGALDISNQPGRGLAVPQGAKNPTGISDRAAQNNGVQNVSDQSLSSADSIAQTATQTTLSSGNPSGESPGTRMAYPSAVSVMPRTPSIPTAVVAGSAQQNQSGAALQLLAGLFGGVNLVISGISDFFRGLFSVFVH